jgi:hypothetical protein
MAVMADVTRLLDAAAAGDPHAAAELLPLVYDELRKLAAARDPVRAELVKLRYFAGLAVPRAAAAPGISGTTAERYWAFARAWLFADLNGPGDNPRPG